MSIYSDFVAIHKNAKIMPYMKFLSPQDAHLSFKTQEFRNKKALIIESVGIATEIGGNRRA